MALALRGTPTFSVNAAVNKPTGVISGDLVVIVGSVDGTPASFLGPTGFTEVGTGQTSTAPMFRVWRRVCDGSEGPSFTVSAYASSSYALVAIGYQGGTYNASTPVTTPTYANGSGTSNVAPAVTVTNDGSDLISFFGTTGGAYTHSQPTGMTEIGDVNDSWLVFAVDRQAAQPPGTTGTRTSTASGGSTWTAGSFLVQPSGGVTVGSVGAALSYGSGHVNSSIPVPSGVVAGDLVVAYLYADDSTPVVIPPTGFSEVQFTTPPNTGGSPSMATHIFWKRTTGADSGTYTFTHASANTQGVAIRYTGAAATGTPVKVYNGAYNTSQVALSPSIGYSTSVANEFLVYGASDYAATTYTMAGWTIDFNTSGEMHAHLNVGTSGTGGAAQATAGVAQSQIAYLIAILPVGSGTAAPSDISGLAYRWRADSIAQANASAVTTWASLASQGGGSVPLVQGTGAAQPTYQTGVLNGQPIVRFDGTSDYLTATIQADVQPLTLSFVFKASSIPGAAAYAELFDAGSGVQVIWGNTNTIDAYAGTDLMATGRITTTGYHVLTCILNGASSAVWWDGAQAITGAAGSNALAAALAIGRQSGAAARYAGMDLAEINVYNKALTTGASSDMTTLDTYYNTRYGIAVADVAGVMNYTPSATDAAGASDAAVDSWIMVRPVTDTARAADAYTKTVNGINVTKTAADTAAASDREVHRISPIRAVAADTAGASDRVTKSLVFGEMAGVIVGGYEPWAGAAHGWRYLAQKIDGSGYPGEWLDNELPLQNVQLTDTLSGPPQGSGEISPQYRRLLDYRGEPLLGEWGVVIYAEADGEIQHAGIVVHSDMEGPKWSVEWSGFSGYATGMGYESTYSKQNIDPLDVVRHIWAHIQSGQDSNILLSIDTTKTPVRLGLPVPDPSTPTGSDPVMQDKPYELNYWSTDDLGSEVDKLASDTPFDYRERHYWDSTRTEVQHFLELGYPTLGRRRTDMRFVVGENVQTVPTATREGDEFANHVRMLGAGEGSLMIKGEARRRDGRLRRMTTLDDKSVTDESRAKTAARAELEYRHQMLNLDQLLVRDSPLARLSALRPGDEIRVQSTDEWLREFDRWLRVITVTRRPGAPELVQLALQRPRDGLDQIRQSE